MLLLDSCSLIMTTPNEEEKLKLHFPVVVGYSKVKRNKSQEIRKYGLDLNLKMIFPLSRNLIYWLSLRYYILRDKTALHVLLII